MTHPLLIALVLAGLLPANAGAATIDRPAQISAYRSGPLFSKRDPASGRFRLWYTDAGRPPAPLSIPDRPVPFDADLGPGPEGQLLAVSSRCTREPRWDPLDEDAPPGYSGGQGCDAYEHDLASGRERRMPGGPANGAGTPIIDTNRGGGLTTILLRHDDGGWRSCFNPATGGSPETCAIQSTVPYQ